MVDCSTQSRWSCHDQEVDERPNRQFFRKQKSYRMTSMLPDVEPTGGERPIGTRTKEIDSSFWHYALLSHDGVS